MQRAKYLLKNTMLLALGNLGTKLISFLLVPLYTNVLTTSEYGTIDLVTAICTIAMPIITLGISEGILRFSLDKGINYEKIKSICVLFVLFSTIVGLVIVSIAGVFESTCQFKHLIYWYCVTTGYYSMATCYLRGCEKLFAYSISNIINSILIAVLNILFLVQFKMGIEGYYMAFIIANLSVSILIMWHEKWINKNFLRNLDYKLIKQMTKYSVVLIPTTLMWWIMNSSDRIMVTAYIDSSANGIYSISYKIPTILSVFATIFNQAWSYSAIKEESSDKVEYSNMMYSVLFSALLICAATVMFVMKPLLSVYVNDSYFEAWKYTPYLIIGFVFMTMSTFLSTSYTVHKDSRGFLISGSLGAALNIILNAVMIPALGISGAALATLLSYFTVFVYRIIDTSKYLVLKWMNIPRLVSIILLAIMGASMYLNGIKCQIILFIEMLVVYILNAIFLVMFWRRIKKIIKEKI